MNSAIIIENWSFLVLGVLFVAFLYWGYKDDFRRDPKEFLYSVGGTILHLFGIDIRSKSKGGHKGKKMD